MSEETISLWTLLKRNKVVIPIIQRDYAQGRTGKEYLRQRFLEQLHSAFEKNAEPLVLDFVYGSMKGDAFNPLDGQQRFTTLWLLHWYLSLCAGTLKEDGKILKRFSYETRISSKTFCWKLCSIDIDKPYYEAQKQYQAQEQEQGQEKKPSITDFIRNQPWFYSAYEQDPTIQSMLRMLGGTPENEEIKDGIEKIFPKEKAEAGEILERLKGNGSPIRFYLLDMKDKDMPLTDDLYIKMNARGKVLTDFENFKADLLKYIEKNIDEKHPISDDDFSDGDFKKKFDDFKQKLDKEWTDLFWHHRSGDHRIDDIYMSFLNRFFLVRYIEKKSYKEITENKKDSLYKLLIDRNIPDCRYQDISIYKPILTRDLESLRTCLDNLIKIHDKVDFNPYWEDKADGDKANGIKGFYFIPRYNYKKDGGNDTIIMLTWTQRVVFYAVCVYLVRQGNDIDKEKLQNWLHVVWNIVENSVNDEESGINAIRLLGNEINQLQVSAAKVEASKDIYAYLAGVDETKIGNLSSRARQQLLEEIKKAKRIVAHPEWKEKIYQAEKTAFFKGAIAFLFHDAEGNLDWEDFDKKLENAEKLFDDKGVKTEKQLARAMQTLYSHCNNWDKQFWWHPQIFNGKAYTWKYILTKKEYAGPVHHLLMGAGPNPNPHMIDESSNTEMYNRILRLLSTEALTEFIAKKNWEEKRDMYIRDPNVMLRYCGTYTGVELNVPERDTCLKELINAGKIVLKDEETEKIEISKDDYDDATIVFWGPKEINFVYKYEKEGYCKELNLQWYPRNDRECDVYLMNEKWDYQRRHSQKEDEKKEDRKEFYCFDIDKPKDNNWTGRFQELVKENFAEFLTENTSEQRECSEQKE